MDTKNKKIIDERQIFNKAQKFILILEFIFHRIFLYEYKENTSKTNLNFYEESRKSKILNLKSLL